MKFRNILLTTFAASAFVIGTTSCSDSFLDEKMYSSYGPEVSDVNAKLVGLHRQYAAIWGMSSQQGFVGCWQVGTDVGAPGDTQGVEVPFYRYQELNAENAGVSFLWEKLYELINSANQIIASQAEGGDAAATAEAMFFRAYAYNMLVTLWGDVPLVTESTSIPRTDYTRNAVAEVDGVIDSDLVYAMSNLPVVGAATMKAENLTLDMFKGYAYLYIEGYLVQDHELILRAMQLGKEAGLQICLDMASYNIVEGDLEFFDILITKYVDIVFANEEEAKAYTGKDAWGAINEIASKCSVVIVKLGAQGSCIKKGTECIKLEVPPVKKVVDTTGAGDYYAAGFLYGLTCGYSLEKCSIIGSILASNVIQVVGTTLSKKKWDEIKLNIEALLQA